MGMHELRAIETERRLKEALAKAKDEGHSISYIDHDGCEVTANPDGTYFFDASDWW